VLAELDGNEIWVKCNFAENKLVGSVPGMKFHKGKDMWRVPATWTACLTMRAMYGSALELGPKLKEWAWEQAARENGLRLLGDSMDVDLPGTDERLFGYQRAGVAFMAEAEAAILGDEPGLGKTAQAIQTVKRMHEQGKDVLPMLIICPNSLKKNWEKEFAIWWPDFQGTISVVDGSVAQRRKALGAGAQVDVINWEAVRLHSSVDGYGSIRLKACAKCGGIENPRPDEEYKAAVPEAKCERHKRELNTKGYKTVIVDEAHRGKSQDAKQTRAVWSVLSGATYRFLLTGTPIADNVGDVWSLLHGIHPEAFPVRSKFLDTFATTRLNFFGGFEVLGLRPDTADTFRRILSSYMRRTPKSLALPQLPPKLPMQYRYVKLKPQQAKQYKQMKEGMLTLLDNDMPLTAESAVTQFSRLKQFASATGTWNAETGKVELAEPSSKVDELLDFMQDEQKPLVVAAQTPQLLKLAGKRLTAEKYRVGYITGEQSIDERDVAVRDFQEGKLDVVLVNAAGAEGITLTRADTLVFIERFDNPVKNEQMENRIYRIGSERHEAIRIVCILAEDTIETNREYNLWQKQERAEEVIQDKERIRRMLK
jgi:SWI/SNF-related matrix-associated actin-dependent regulator 1 of chromatin subfamily A